MTETPGQRLESKVDALIASASKQEQALNRLADKVESDKRLTDQMVGFMQQAIDRVQGELDEERSDRRVADEKIEARLSKVGYALFTALLALVGSGLAYILFTSK